MSGSDHGAYERLRLKVNRGGHQEYVQANTSDLRSVLLHLAASDSRIASLEGALKEARAAVDFFDRVNTFATVDEKIAVGQDHWDRMEAALRTLALLAPADSEEG